MSRATVGACGRFACVLVCLFGLALESGRTQSPPPPATLVPIAAGATHSLAIDTTGAIWSWGSNVGGVLGDGTTTPRLAPVPVTGAVGVFTQVAAGGTHSLARRTDGRIVAWGANGNGEVGDASTTPRLAPVVLAAPTDVVAVAAGGNHSLALRSDGTLVAWGLNNEGQLGDNTRTRRLSPVPVSGLTNVIAIAAGGLHSLALAADGRVFSWGAGSAGQLGLGSTSRRLVPTPIASLSGVVAISAGAFHSAAVTATGALAVWGNNATYQLGDSTQTPRLSPVFVPGLTGVTGVSAGAGHTLAMTSSQSLYAWGSNLGSQLGDGTNTTRSSPVAVTPPAAVSALAAGGAHSVVLGADASVWAAGANLLGQVGDGSFVTATRFVPISGPGQTWGVFPPSLAPSGGNFSAPQTITTSTPTAGATVRYTTTGADPVAADPTWPSEGLTLAAPTTLKVRGFKAGMTPSTVTTGVYAFAVNPPIATPSSGTYTTPQTVSLSTTTPGATITYTLDGTDPTEGSAVYVAPFAVSTSSTLKVRAFRAGWQPSAMLSYVYTFNLGTLATPTAVPPAGSYSAPQTVVLSAEPGGTIRYTLGGVDPTEASPVYAAPIAVASTTVLKARAYRSDWTPSAILTASYVIESNSEPLPPDPSTVATPINPATITDFAEANAFLYAGPDPIQRGATASAFDPRRLAIVRGRVLDRAGQPLSGARITIADNVAFGHTLSRADGMYDMAVNGGGAVVVDIERPGYLPVQRRVETQWHAWRWADDVRLTPLDPVATAVRFDAGAPPQRARGSLVSDENGPRQATVIVPEGGVSANLELADGSVLPNQAQLTLRATEYTVGAAGPEAMPGELPGTSGYTYAVDLTADEAVQAGAVRVTFDPALVFYVDNFLDFPVGGSVPAGSYDRAAAAWVAEGNGRIVRILEPDGTGTAQLDIDGTGNPATPEALTALGVTLGERQQLSALYQPGKSLWRVPMAHFSPWDCNWPYGPPSDLVRSSLGTPFSDRQDDDPCEEGGSIIECQNQTLGERLPIAGTPFTLNYRSNRQPGRAATRGLTIPLTGSVVGSTFFGGTLDVQVAGQRIRQNFGPSPNQATNVIWNGRDVYGREVEGAQPASVTVRHDYPAEYQQPAELDRNFALPSGSGVLAANRTRGVFTFTQSFGTTLGGASTPSAPIGGWSLDVHHTYDPKSRTLYLGDGSRRTDVAPGPTIRTAAGGGQAQPSSSPAPAVTLALPPLRGVGALPDGSFILTSSWDGGSPSTSSRTFRLDRDGLLAELPVQSLTEDYFGRAVAVDGAGRVFVSEGLNFQGACGEGGSYSGARVSEISLTGGLTPLVDVTPAGEGSECPRTQLAAARDGTLFLGAGQYLYRIGVDRVPVLLLDLGFDAVRGLAVAADGTLYFSTYGLVERLTRGGVRERVAGTGEAGHSGDGGPATEAQVTGPSSIVARPDGSVLFLDNRFSQSPTVRRVGPDGIISTIGGGGAFASNIREGAPAVGSYFGAVPDAQLAVALDGSVLLPDGANSAGHLYRMAGEIDSLSSSQIQLPSANGAELYVFDLSGRHLRTHDALLGTTLFTFSYDTAGRVIRVRDRDNLETVIERGAGGQPLAIVGPFGQRTAFTLHPDGYLASVANPAGEAVGLAYAPGGLLTGMTTPRNETYTFSYDAFGRLETDADPAGGVQTLARTDEGAAWGVVLAHNQGHARLIRHEDLGTGDRQYQSVGRDGTTTQQTQTTAGTVVSLSPDGTQTVTSQGPDPRFGMQSPLGNSTTVTTPGGRVWQASSTRVATLADPQNLLSLTRQTDTTVINGRTWRQVFDVPTRTLTATTAANRTTTTVFDAAGRVSQVTAGSLLPVTFTYTPQGEVNTVTQGTRTTTFTYDTRGRVERVMDPLSREASFAYDLADRVTSQTLPGGRVVGFGYDPSGNVTAVTPPGQPEHGFAHTPVDLPERYDPPAAAPGGPTTATFRIDRAVQTVTRPDGLTLTLGYDAEGRPETLTTPTGTTTWTYAPTSGLVTSIATPDTTVGIGYDGSLPTSMTWTGAVTGSVGVTYDNFLRASGQTVNGGASVAFTYDFDNLLTGAGVLTIARQPATGLITGTTLAGVSESRTLNGFGEVSTRTFTRSGSSLYSASYTRDALARIESKTEMVAGATQVTAYTYDPAGRLETVTRDGVLAASYGYDANGNRTSTTTSGGAVSATYDAQDRLQQWDATTYTYTSAGELLTKTEPGVGTTIYTYDVQGNLRQVALPTGTVLQYQVDALNRRIGRLVNGVRTHGWLWAGMLRPVAELDAAGAVVSRFVYGTGLNVPDYLVRGGQTYRLITDHLGSVRLVVAVASGAVVQQLDYDAWGRVTLDTNPGWQPFGFAGGIYDSATGLVRFGARDYDARVGRWITKDPIGLDGGSNAFGYADGDPVNLVDSEGKFANLAIGALSGLVTGYLIAKLTGDACYGWDDALTDAAMGAVGAGVLSKLNKLSRIAELRRAASANGLARKATTAGGVETWSSAARPLETLKIKHLGATAKGLHPDSTVPRFSYRIGQGEFWDPFTGEIGRKGALSHVPLEPVAPGLSTLGGALGGALRTPCPCQ